MELWARNCPIIFPKFQLPPKFRDLLNAANLRHGTDGFTSPPKEGVLRIFFALKNSTVSAGFEPVNFGTKDQHATPRPPKPLEEITGDHQCGFSIQVDSDNIVCVRQILEKN